MSKFGWDLPPGCSIRDIERAAGAEGPLDCPVCADGIEMDGPDCEINHNHGVTCKTHGCIACQDLEKRRVYCNGPWCGDYIRTNAPHFTHEGKTYCSQACIDSEKDAERTYEESEQ